MNTLAALGGVLLEPVAHCLALAVVELEVVHHHLERTARPATRRRRRTRHVLAKRRRDPAPVDETGKNEAVEQQRQAEQELNDARVHVQMPSPVKNEDISL